MDYNATIDQQGYVLSYSWFYFAFKNSFNWSRLYYSLTKEKQEQRKIIVYIYNDNSLQYIQNCVHLRHGNIQSLCLMSLIFLNIVLWSLFDLLYYHTIFQLIEPKAKNEPVDWDKVAMFRTEVEKTVGYLENVWLKDRPFLCGNELSVADILGICELMQLNAVHEEKLYEDNAVVKAWADRVKQRLQPHFDEAHKMTYRTREMYPSIAKQLAKL